MFTAHDIPKASFNAHWNSDLSPAYEIIPHTEPSTTVRGPCQRLTARPPERGRTITVEISVASKELLSP
jgi:hypothetical protein